jgi:hypothetical protein
MVAFFSDFSSLCAFFIYILFFGLLQIGLPSVRLGFPNRPQPPHQDLPAKWPQGPAGGSGPLGERCWGPAGIMPGLLLTDNTQSLTSRRGAYEVGAELVGTFLFALLGASAPAKAAPWANGVGLAVASKLLWGKPVLL